MAEDVVREREAGPPRRRTGGKRTAAGRPAARANPHEAVVLGVRITNADRVIEPVSGTTKGDVARHYAKVGRKMLPHVDRRPLSLVRCPEGTAKGCFYQKHLMTGWPPEVKGIRVRESDGEEKTYVTVDSVEGLVALAQVGTIEVHAWGSRAGDPEAPGRMVIDLDPAPGVPWARVVEAAREARRRLRARGFASEPVATGGKGLHVVAPVGSRRLTWDQVRDLTHEVASAMATERPDLYVAKASKAERRGKVFVDWLRNLRGATAVVPWSMRARAGVPVARPVTWASLPRLDPGTPPRPARIAPRPARG
jgi:bifunctional non-homologous end joining protein LigD